MASGGGRINQYLERQFASIYEQALSPQTLVGVLKDRQDDAMKNLTRRLGADKENLNKEDYSLLFSKNSNEYLKEGTKKAEEQRKAEGITEGTGKKPMRPISAFGGGQGGSFSSNLESLNVPNPLAKPLVR